MRDSVAIVLFFIAGSVQGICVLALAIRDWHRLAPFRAWYALAWCALVSVAYVAFIIWYPDWPRAVAFLRTGEITALDRPGVPRGSMSAPQLAAEYALSGLLIPLWSLVAALQYRGGRIYRAALWATLLPSAIVGYLASAWLALGLALAFVLAVLALLQRLGLL